MFRISNLATLLLALGAAALPASAQDATRAAEPQPEPTAAPDNSPDAIARAARNILELVEVHNFRIRRIDSAVGYFRDVADQDKLRQSLLREREQHQYQQSLETYRRMLGDADFARVAGLLRNHFETRDERPSRSSSDVARQGSRAEDETERRDTAAQRAERVRSMLAAQAAEARDRAAQQAAYERGQMVARMRASERAQLAQRLTQARAEQLQARAAAAQRYKPTPESPSNRRADPSQGGWPGRPGAGGRNQGRGPWQQQPQRP